MYIYFTIFSENHEHASITKHPLLDSTVYLAPSVKHKAEGERDRSAGTSMLPCCNTWVGGRTGSLPLALSGSGSGIIQRRAEASARLGERANAVDERRDGSPLSQCLML